MRARAWWLLIGAVAALAGCRRKDPGAGAASAGLLPVDDPSVLCLESADGCVFCVGKTTETLPQIPPEQPRPSACDPKEPDSCVEFCSELKASCALPWSQVPACVFESADAFQRARFSRDTADRPVVSPQIKVVDAAGRRLEGAVAQVWVSYRDQTTRLLDEQAGRDGVIKLHLPKGPWTYTFRFGAKGHAAALVSHVAADKLDAKGGPGGLPRTQHLEAESPVRGLVVDGATNAPIAEARVEAVRALRDTIVSGLTVTGADGTFTVPELDARSHHLRISKFGFSKYLSKTAVAPAARVTVKLTKVSALQGVVRGEDGEPVSNATVVAVASGMPSSPSGPIIWTTDGEGRFAEDRWFEAGTYYLWARHRDMFMYPPHEIALTASDHQEVALRLLHKAARVSGQVVAEGGGPLPEGTRVELVGRSPLAFPRTAAADLQGKSFVISGVLPGRYAVSVRRHTVVSGPREVEVPIDPGVSVPLAGPLVVRPLKAE